MRNYLLVICHKVFVSNVLPTCQKVIISICNFWFFENYFWKENGKCVKNPRQKRKDERILLKINYIWRSPLAKTISMEMHLWEYLWIKLKIWLLNFMKNIWLLQHLKCVVWLLIVRRWQRLKCQNHYLTKPQHDITLCALICCLPQMNIEHAS